jgi:hypothetical protein
MRGRFESERTIEQRSEREIIETALSLTRGPVSGIFE